MLAAPAMQDRRILAISVAIQDGGRKQAVLF
jgi:hypothetical protein